MHCLTCNSTVSHTNGKCETCGRPMETDADSYFRAGMDALAVNDYQRAETLFSDCLCLNPRHVSARFNLGLALNMAERCEEAVDQFAIIMETEPDYPGICTALGQALFGSYIWHREQAEQLKETMIKVLTRAVEEDPEDVDAHFSLANSYIAVGEPEEALRCLYRALELQDDSWAIYLALAKTLAMLGRRVEAAQMASKALEFSDEDNAFREEIWDLLSELQQIPLPLY